MQAGFARLPELVEPMLASPGALPPAGQDDEWAYEFKWDGVRALARVEGGRLQLFSRKGNDITVTYPELRVLGEELGSTQVWLDGEIVAMEDGRPSFPALQQRMHVQNDRQARNLANAVPVTYLIFDVLYLDGKSCVDLPYAERRRLLEGLELRGPHWNTSPSYAAEGTAMVETAREQELEGVVAKRLTSRYFPGRRTPDWIKIKEVTTIEVLIGGWRPGEGRRSGAIGSLMLGVPTDAGLRYVGQVGTGFTDKALAALGEQLEPLERKVVAVRRRGAGGPAPRARTGSSRRWSVRWSSGTGRRTAGCGRRRGGGCGRTRTRRTWRRRPSESPRRGAGRRGGSPSRARRTCWSRSRAGGCDCPTWTRCCTRRRASPRAR